MLLLTGLKLGNLAVAMLDLIRRKLCVVVLTLVVVGQCVVGRRYAVSVIACDVLCKKPFVKGIQPYPCGQCLPCRLNRRRLWTHRLLLEARDHEFTSFATLTYHPDYVPVDGSLNPKHTQLWLKRLRSLLGPTRPLRYYLVGEYGDDTFRPHYHAALFGLSHLESELLQKSWSMGGTFLGTLTDQSAQYIAGYVTKKMTAVDDPRLGGRHPEFARMSLRPGIGAGAVVPIAEALNCPVGAASVARDGDVPTQLLLGRKSLPLGRYLRRKLREELGFDTIGGQKKPEALRQEEMQSLLETSGSRSRYLQEKPFVEHQKIVQVEGKAKIWSKKGKL